MAAGILAQGSAPVNVTVLNATIHNATAAAATVNPGNVDAGLMVFVEETLTVVTLLLMVLAVSLQLASVPPGAWAQRAVQQMAAAAVRLLLRSGRQ